MNARNRFVLISFVIFEFVLLNIILLTFYVFAVPGFTWSDNAFLNNFTILLLIFNLSWLFIILYIRVKDFYFNPNYKYVKNFALSFFFFIGIASTLMLVFQVDFFEPLTLIVPIFIFTYINILTHKFLLRFLKKNGTAKLISNALLISSESGYPKLKEFMNNISGHGYKLLGYLDDKEIMTTSHGSALEIIGNIKDLPDVLDNNSVDEIFITMSSLKEEKIKASIKVADNYGVRVTLVPENPTFIAENYKAGTMGDIAVFQLRQSPLDIFSNMVIKRLFDFLFALIIILLLSPIFLIIGVIILLDMKGPMLYTPTRKGEGGGTFKCYKFRTMSVCDNPLNGTKSTAKNDPRITAVGRILRKSDLDELPQFFNVLKGEMSVIGPRPHRSVLQNDFRKIVNDYMVRSYIKPGITGWAQVNGWRGPTVTEEQKKQRVKHDLWYIENWNFWLDLKIIFLTLFGRHRKNAF